MKEKVFKFSIIVIFVLGVFLRLKIYLFNISFWSDESALALNIINRSFFNLLKPFDFNQCAPFLFAVFSKIFYMLFGINELVFRFIPFLASILSIPAFYFLSKKVLNKKWSILIANYLFAVNFSLIFYCQTFKQYSLEVLITIFMVLCLTKINIKTFSIKKCLMLGFAFFVMFLFSMPTPFILAAFLLYLIYKNKKESINQIFFISLPFVLCILPYYFIYLHPSKITMINEAYGIWQNGYLSLNSTSLMALIRNFFYFVFTPNSSQFLTMLLCFMGAVLIFKDRKKIGVLILFIIIMAFVASLFRMYPLYDRLCLYLVPFIILFAVRPLEKLSNFNNVYDWKKCATATILTIVFLFCFRTNCISHLLRLQNPETFNKGMSRQIMEIIKKDLTPSDVIISNRPTIQDMLYYLKYFKLQNEVINIGAVQNVDYEEYDKILNNLQNNKKYYFYYFDCFGKNDNLPFINAFERWIKNNNVKILYEFKNGFDYYVKFMM